MSLRKNDLKNLVKPIFEIDNFRSNLGDDENIVVLSFTVESQESAKDLENFIEMGYPFVIDADTTPGELDDGKYRVFVEIERNKHIAEQILEIADGIKKLTELDQLKFRYYKNFRSQDVTEENLASTIPLDPTAYKIALEKTNLDNFTEFFNKSYADEIKLLDESISFKRIWKDPVSFNIVTSGSKDNVYTEVKGPILLESNAIAESIFLTKYIGDYNITKVGKTFIFESNGWAVALERKQ